MNDFCSFLSNGLYVTDKVDLKNLQFQPCCFFNAEKNYTEYHDSREEWKNINSWTDSCISCKNKENFSKKSHRTIANSLYNDVEGLAHLEINYGNACNAACGMCNSISSSRIAKQDRLEGKNYVPAPTVNKRKFYEFFDNLEYDYIKVLKFQGGEPFYTDFHKNIIKKVKHPEVATLSYQTNGSIYPDEEWWDLVQNFENIYISFSIDAVGEQFNYVRYGLNWEQVYDNMEKIISKKTHNISWGIHCTINPLTLYYMDRVFQKYTILTKINKKSDITFSDSRKRWSLQNTTPKLYEMFIEKYKNFSFAKFFNYNQFDINEYSSYIKSIELHETRYNLNGLEIFPEIYDIAIDKKILNL